MRPLITFLFVSFCFLFLSCQKDDLVPVVLPFKGPFGLVSEKNSICPGTNTQLVLLTFASMEKGQEIPISELVFDPIPTESGKITESGIFMAPDVVSETHMVKIKAKFRKDSKIHVSLDLELISSEKSKIAIIEVTNLWNSGSAIQRHVADMNTEGEFLLGPTYYSGPSKDMSFEASVFDSLGNMKWHYNGIGIKTSFLKFLDDHILISGIIITREGSYVNKTVLLDENGKEVTGFKFSESLVPVGFYKNGNGDFFIRSQDYTKPNQFAIQKLNPDFEIEWEKIIEYPIDQFLVTNEEEILIHFLKDFGKEAGLAFFDRNGNEVWKIDLGDTWLNSTHLTEMPDGNLGLIRSEGRSYISDVDWVYYGVNKTGQIIQSREVIFSGISFNNTSYVSGVSSEKYVSDISRVLISKAGELLLLGTASTKSSEFLVIKGLKKSSLEIRLSRYEGILQFIKNKSGLRIATRNLEGLIKKYYIGPNLEFNLCMER